MRTVIYTAIFGGRDRLWPPRQVEPDCRYVCFTDDRELEAELWEVRVVPRSDFDPVRSARRWKILSHRAVDCDRSIWIDAIYEIVGPLAALFERFTEDLAVFRHPVRDCVYEEAAECIRRGRDDPELIQRTLERLRRQTHPPHAGLFESGFLLRRHSAAVAEFNESWWNEIRRGTRRDQVSLPGVLSQLNLPHHCFLQHEKTPFLRMRQHRRGFRISD